MICKGCNRAVYDSDVDRNGLCCFCSPEGEALKGQRPASVWGVGQAADFGDETPATLHGTETVVEPDEPKKRPRRKAR